ncbi:unnamed protein product [Rhizophagus irregularis]|uniref:Uncharacterized protein n=1 Tax=Rhizophagus irregularis TaxID=588596 RepID=A0A915ZR45_9GLOM|nr:unnamed protein product [Rhizophagus irregularis]CAB5395016.1 unnamed protein product [Rhizophagus irregularis]
MKSQTYHRNKNLYDENVPTLQCLCENVPSTNRVIAFPLFQQHDALINCHYGAVTRDKSPDPIVVKRIPIVYFAPLVVLQDWANSSYYQITINSNEWLTIRTIFFVVLTSSIIEWTKNVPP